MRWKPSAFLADQSGGMIVVFALASTALCLAAGMAIDYSRTLHVQSGLQKSADAAALAGAGLIGASDQERIAVATKFFNSNVQVTPPPAPAITSVSGTVAVAVETAVPTTLMNLAGISELEVGIDAEASAAISQLACVITLEETEFGLQANSDSTLNAACGVQVNSRGVAAHD